MSGSSMVPSSHTCSSLASCRFVHYFVLCGTDKLAAGCRNYTHSQKAAWWYQLTKKMGGMCVVTAGEWGPFQWFGSFTEALVPPKIP
ncbi:hypothetical protein D623_10035470 [Myotis brandtii]|uniref:Uncharacterized protein n=1 Tax=Myotis brandtii TaxID=109478 RepID=S7MMX2_MYOBR|nr:hypothetical protein D623_10035470 [Myotis brandtii]